MELKEICNSCPNMTFHEFKRSEAKRLKEKYSIGLGTKITDKLYGYNLFDYMCEFSERYRKVFPEVRHKKELKCNECDFETEKENVKGMEKHTATHQASK